MPDRKIAVLLPSPRPAQWIVKALELLHEVSGLELLLFLAEGPAKAQQRWGPLHGLYQNFCNRRGRIAADRPSPLSPSWCILPCVDRTAAVDTLIRESPEVILDLGWPWKHDPDLRERLPAPLWRFSHLNSAQAFWDTLNGQEWTGAELIASHQGREEILHREHFRTAPGSYSNTLHKLRHGSCYWPALALQVEHRPGIQPRPESELPGNLAMLKYLARSTASKLTQRLKPAPAWKEQWAIGVLQQSARQTLSSGIGAVRWLHPPPGCFAADPFLWRQGEEYFIFFELLRHQAPFGEIAFVSTHDFVNFSPVEIVIGAPGRHWSYPFLIDWEGSTYCVPEHCQGNQVLLYKAHQFPRDWRPEALLLDNFPGVDPTIFVHEGRHWMLVGDTTSEYDCLHAFHATSPTGPWLPHEANPVICSRSHLARPAGRIFESDGKLYRPAQMGHRYYGYGILIYEIQELTCQSYRERPVRCLQPEPTWPYPDGLHQLDSLGQWTVIDAKLHTVDGGSLVRNSPGIQLQLKS